MWKYPRPDTWQTFEQILVDWVQHSLGDTGADRYGRTGQRQNGIDILARNWRGVTVGASPEIWAFQAKDYTDTTVTTNDAQRELTKALSHGPRPDVFVLATTTQRDTRLQDWALVASRTFQPTRVEVWFWEGFVEQCLKERWFREKYLAAFWEHRVPHQLPSPPADFTGRDAEIVDFLAQLDRGANTLVVSGMGGVGKTALGLAIAERITHRYSDGQIRIDLRGTDAGNRVSPTDAMSRVVRALDPQSSVLTSFDDIANAYQTALHQKRVLLLLDDAYDANQVEALVPPPQSGLLITSRQRILLPGVSSHVLSTLSVPDSCRLLSRICSRVQDEAQEIAALCGCLPLALRLAGTALAARPDLTIDQYTQRLREERTRLEFVNATVELSYQLLSEELRAAWTALSAFRGPFDGQAAGAILSGTERNISDALGDLLRHSMVEWDSTSGRYSMHELLRLVADSRLSDSGRDEIHLRHAQHYQDRLRSLKLEYRQGNESALVALQQFDRDMPHVHQAIVWLRARLARGNDYKILFSLYLDAGVNIFPIRFDAEELVAWLKDAVAATRALNQMATTATHLGNLGTALQRVGDYEGAIRVQEEVLQIARRSTDPGDTAYPLGNLATLYLNTGEFSKSIEFALQSIRIEQRRGNRQGVAADLNTLGQAYLHTGEHEMALLMFTQSLELKRQIGDRLGQATTLAGIASLYDEQEKYEVAATYFSQAATIFRELGYKQGEERARSGLCLSILKGGVICGLNPDQVSEILKSAGDGRQIAVRVLRHLADGAARAKALGQDIEYAARIGDMGTLQSALGDDEGALALHNESIKLGRKTRTAKLEANSHFNKAISLARLNRIDEAIEAMESARRLYESLGLPDATDAEKQLSLMREAIAPTSVARRATSAGSPVKKVGRNERCPCGSGKKYKHCCLRR